MSGLGLAFCCHLVVIDTTFSDDQQEGFVARLHDENPKIPLLRLDSRVTAPESLTETVKKALAHTDGPRRQLVPQKKWADRLRLDQPCHWLGRLALHFVIRCRSRWVARPRDETQGEYEFPVPFRESGAASDHQDEREPST
jgi:hypothetical protein